MKLLKKKHSVVSVLTVMAILFTFHPAMSFAATELSDISGHWAKDQIQSWVDSGYIKGYPGGSFKPDNSITRAEFMTIVNNAYGFTAKADVGYTDVAAGAWYADAISAAKAAGYITGYPDNTMRPNNPISRQEAAVMIARIDALVLDEASADQFTDAAAIPAWSKGAIGADVKADILTGYPNGSYQGENLILRGESVVALTKAKAYSDTHVAVTKTITDATTGGFTLTLSPAVDLLTSDNVILKQGDTPVTVSAITTSDSGMTYTIGAALEEGQTYTLSVSKAGYSFGDDSTITVVNPDKIAADTVNAQIAALPAIDALTLDDEAVVTAAKAAYDELSDSQKGLVSTENQTKLDDAVAKINDLQTAAGQTDGTSQQ